MYRQQKFIGWVCRMWSHSIEHGWTSYFETFPTREKAEECGRTHNSYLRKDETAREYEIYKQFTEPF